jgi:dTDP-glucose 4,6-dehydratase/UDP-glucuronate decarboxylase
VGDRGAALANLVTATANHSIAISAVVHDDLDDICARAAPALRALAGKTVLVAGGAGFLPSYVVDALARANETMQAEPCRIICVDNVVTGAWTRLAHLEGRPDIAFRTHDLTQKLVLDEPVHAIVHGASIASPSWYRRRPLETIDVNVIGTRYLLELAREEKVESFLYLSSSEVYGDPDPARVPTTEDYWGNVSSTGPRAPYDESKRLAETLCATYHRLYGTPVRIVRPFNVYGPRLRLDDGRVIPDFLSDALARRPIALLSDGRATRSFCYVGDFTAALLLLLVEGSAGEVYNVGNDEEVTIREAAEILDGLPGVGVGVASATSDDADYLTDNPSRRCPDLSKTRAAIDWSPSTPLREGLHRTLASYRGERSA